MDEGPADPARPLAHFNSWFWLLAGPFSPCGLFIFKDKGCPGLFHTVIPHPMKVRLEASKAS